MFFFFSVSGCRHYKKKNLKHRQCIEMIRKSQGGLKSLFIWLFAIQENDKRMRKASSIDFQEKKHRGESRCRLPSVKFFLFTCSILTSDSTSTNCGRDPWDPAGLCGSEQAQSQSLSQTDQWQAQASIDQWANIASSLYKQQLQMFSAWRL